MRKHIKKILSPDDRFLMQFIRYFFVGGLATIFDILIFTLLSSGFGLHYLYIAQPAGFITGVSVNYALSVTVVFTQRNYENVWKERFVFFLTALIGFFMNSGLLFLFVEYLTWNLIVAKIIAVALTFAWNFLSKKILLYRNSK